VNIVIEGTTDEPVVRRVLSVVGFNAGTVYIQGSKGKLDKKVAAYNNAAKFAHWLVLRDMDRDADCPSTLVRQLLPTPSQFMCLRIAVRSMEAWLLADREKISDYLGVSIARIPLDPESLLNPKTELVEIAKHARRREIREDIVPASQSIASVGVGYTLRVGEFASKVWRPKVAARQSRSLARCLVALNGWK